MKPSFSEPSESDYHWLAMNWRSISDLVQEDYSATLDQSLASLDLLQRVHKDDLVGHQGYIALGVVLGRIMVKNIPGLDWWVVLDEFGRDLCVRWRYTTLRINPVSMVVKRSGPDGELDFRQLFGATMSHITELAGQVD